jgi:hypothetical protein
MQMQVAQMKLFVRELQLSEQFPKISYIYWDEQLTSLGSYKCDWVNGHKWMA